MLPLLICRMAFGFSLPFRRGGVWGARLSPPLDEIGPRSSFIGLRWLRWKVVRDKPMPKPSIWGRKTGLRNIHAILYHDHINMCYNVVDRSARCFLALLG
jgi:hypothetical protein